MAVKITHVMADGTVRESMEGVTIPLTPRTRKAYELLAKAHRERMAQQEKAPEKVS